jgi:hypothetical protein
MGQVPLNRRVTTVFSSPLACLHEQNCSFTSAHRCSPFAVFEHSLQQLEDGIEHRFEEKLAEEAAEGANEEVRSVSTGDGLAGSRDGIC